VNINLMTFFPNYVVATCCMHCGQAETPPCCKAHYNNVTHTHDVIWSHHSLSTLHPDSKTIIWLILIMWPTANSYPWSQQSCVTFLWHTLTPCFPTLMQYPLHSYTHMLPLAICFPLFTICSQSLLSPDHSWYLYETWSNSSLYINY